MTMESIRISKDESNMIKGVAVILMMVHHFWSGMQPIPSKIAIMGGGTQCGTLYRSHV